METALFSCLPFAQLLCFHSSPPLLFALLLILHIHYRHIFFLSLSIIAVILSWIPHYRTPIPSFPFLCLSISSFMEPLFLILFPPLYIPRQFLLTILPCPHPHSLSIQLRLSRLHCTGPCRLIVSMGPAMPSIVSC